MTTNFGSAATGSFDGGTDEPPRQRPSHGIRGAARLQLSRGAGERILHQATIAQCLSLVSRETGFSLSELTSPNERRGGAISRARALVCWLARKNTARSYPVIGMQLNMDHSSVIYACRKAETLLKTDPAFHRMAWYCDAAWNPPEAGLLSMVAP